ncbi:hypothetical protein [Patulibacter defluvii]|uniref:hypothetical protein n=1 Tax=Patulibacter defluvii TaxID=3095358 RepID=UPI002A752693|nr:hypothetical protein [Patulibacter sp. DM4]
MAGTSKKRSRASRKKRVAARREAEARHGDSGAPRTVEAPARPRKRSAPRADPVRGGKQLSMKAHRDEAPKPIWAPVPVTEILILAGIVLATIGIFSKSGQMIAGGLVVLGASSTELAIREHFAGYRSHSAMIAGVAAAIVTVAGTIGLTALDVEVPVWAVLVIAAAVFGGAFTALRRAFRARTGGLSFRV